MICTMYPTSRIADSSYVFGAPYSEEVKRRSSIFSTNLTMANADADRLSLDLKSNFAELQPPVRFRIANSCVDFSWEFSRTTRGHAPAIIANVGTAVCCAQRPVIASRGLNGSYLHRSGPSSSRVPISTNPPVYNGMIAPRDFWR